MNTMKKYFAMLASAGLVMAVAAISHAAFTSKGTQVLSASAVTGGTPTVQINSAQIKKVADNSVVSALTWTGATPGAGFLASDDYIQLVSNINTLNGGVQIYTDNHNLGVSNPYYTGLISSVTATPAGLVMVNDTTEKLPTAWMASTHTLTASAINPVNPNAGSGSSFLWFYHEDKSQVAVPVSSAAVFGNGDPYITVYAAPGTPLVSMSDGKTYTTTSLNSGVHFAQNPTSFGGFVSGVANTYIYTEADFTGALAGQTYSTNRLILEAFSL